MVATLEGSPDRGIIHSFVFQTDTFFTNVCLCSALNEKKMQDRYLET